MAFGLTPASNVAQRLAHMFVAVIHKNFDEVEEEYMCTSATDKEKRWCAHRREVAKQSGHKEDRLYCIVMYTDEPMGGILGVRRMVSFLICWTRTTKTMKLKMAIATKRQLGCSVKWIGARYYIAWVWWWCRRTRDSMCCRVSYS